jgi:hypothetical protein
MKLKSIVGVMAASAFVWSAGANAAWFGHGNNSGEHHSFFSSMFHGKNTATYMWNGYEVATPSQVDESAPWIANQPHMPGAVAVQTYGPRISNMVGAVSDTNGAAYATGASSSVGAYGSTSYNSNDYNSSGYGTRGSDSSTNMNHEDTMSSGTSSGRSY